MSIYDTVYRKKLQKKFRTVLTNGPSLKILSSEHNNF